MQFDVVDEILQPGRIARTQELTGAAFVPRPVVDTLVGRRARVPDQLAAAVVDEAKQLCVRKVEFFVGHTLGHLQPTALDMRGGNQRAGIGGQALFDNAFECQAESTLQHGQQRQHEQSGEARRTKHQAQPQRHGAGQTCANACLQPAPA